MTLKAVIFDLDGVLTETAELHYRSWQRLADEEGLAFSREKNEQLRGLSRQRSLQIILGEQAIDPERFAEMLDRKNRYYQEMLTGITEAYLLDGVPALLAEVEKAGIRMAVGSASRNARIVLDALGITGRFALIADGHSVSQAKPAPDLFLYAAHELGVAPHDCLVVEDAESGIDAALAAGTAALGIGPEKRVGHAHLRLDDTGALTLDRLHEAHRRARNWRIIEEGWEPATIHHKETVFTAGNGLLASRGVFEEGYPGEQRATFVHGIFDDVHISFTELANIPDWIALEIDLAGERFRLDRGTLLAFNRILQLDSGLLTRQVTWQSPHGRRSRLRFERFLSRADRGLLAMRVQILPENWSGSVEIRGGLSGYPENQGVLHWRTAGQGQAEESGAVWLHSRTRHTGIELVQYSHLQRIDGETGREYWEVPGQPTQRLSMRAAPGETVTVVKRVTLADSRHHDDLHGAAQAALHAGLAHTFEEQLRASRACWARRWEHSDVEIEGDDEAQVALRYNIFQMLAAAPQQEADDASIGAKSLSGFGYKGHVFWDTELFMLPLLTFTQPAIARNLLLYRYRRLGAAREKARANGFEGAQFPWESAATGREVTPTRVPHFADPTRLVRIWTGDIEIHITADIAYAIRQYWQATGDDAFLRDYGAEIVLSGACFWASRAEWNAAEGRYEYTDVIGPDEYHDHVDNNTFTNRMAQWHLQYALELLAWLQQHAPAKHDALRRALAITDDRLQQWRQIIAKIYLLVNEETGLIEQFEGYFDLKETILADYEPRDVSMQEILGLEGAGEAQAIKQPDVLMLLFLMREAVPQAQVRVNWEYYDPRTDHTYGSSLGPAITAIMGCEMGDPDLAYEHFMRAARADLYDVRGNAKDGIHAASAGALWQAATMGFGGFRLTREGWTAAGRLPFHWRRLAFTIIYRGQRHRVELANGDTARHPGDRKE